VKSIPGIIAVAAVALAQRPAAWRPIELVSSTAAYQFDPLSCRWDRSETAFRRGSGNRIEIACDPAPSDAAILQCDAPGFEPRDVAARALCGSPKIVFDEGQLARIASAIQGDLRLTWFRWPDGPRAELRAQRLASNSSTWSLMAARDSFVRFQLGEFSPRTVPAGELVSASPMALDWRAGGEVFIRQAGGRVVPERVEIVGPRSITRDLNDGWMTEPDLDAGTYTLRRVYVGGIRTAPATATVELGKSTDVGLPLEDVGGVRIAAEPGACGPGDRLQLFRKGSLSPTPIGERRDCQWVVGGLTPGVYLLAVKPSGACIPEITRDVAVAAQQWTDVSIPRAGIVVCGQVSLLGEPLGNMALSFQRDDGFSPAVSVTTDAGGRYALALEQPGAYDVSLRTPHDIQSQQIGVPYGASEYDVKVKGGKVVVVFPPPRSPGNVLLWIDAPSGRSTLHLVRTTAAVELKVFGFGTFGLGGAAVDGPDRNISIERYETVAVSSEKPGARLELRFAKAGQDLDVVDPAGRPISRLRVVRFLADSLPPGLAYPSLFSSAPAFSPRSSIKTTDFNVPMGTPLQLESEDGRTCHTVVSTPREQVVIAPERTPVELRFARPGDDLHGLVRGIPGATCAVPLSRFSSQRTTIDGQEVVRVLLPAGALTLDRDGRTYPIRAPGQGVLIK
jgi:hypothetical protein